MLGTGASEAAALRDPTRRQPSGTQRDAKERRRERTETETRSDRRGAMLYLPEGLDWLAEIARDSRNDPLSPSYKEQTCGNRFGLNRGAVAVRCV